jgi:signal transduction histidine kinase
MQIRALLRTTTFRLSTLYGLIFALGLVALLGLVYLRSAVYLTRRVDGILAAEADGLQRAPPADLRVRVNEALILNGPSHNVVGLFAADGTRIAGDLPALPPTLKPGGAPVEIGPTALFAAPARLIARRLPDGEVLAVGRDVGQLREIRAIIASALLWSGGAVIVIGLACGLALSLRPLQRLRTLQDACGDIAGGDLTRRLPIGAGGDELDMLAGTVNLMIGEVERLMGEVKGATETIAHDLRTPLTRARSQLHRLQQSPNPAPAEIARVTAELDEVLERFRALMRISELEARERRAGFVATDLAVVVAGVGELYQPLAEAEGVTLTVGGEGGATVEADPKLLFEAVSNLVDNAIKFSGEGGAVSLRLGEDPARPRIVVEDDGPGIPAAERGAVRGRFYRGERDRLTPGAGLGLSIVAAIVGLHRFELRLEDADPGLRAVIDCRGPSISH